MFKQKPTIEITYLKDLILNILKSETRPIPKNILLSKVIKNNKSHTYIPNKIFDSTIEQMISLGNIRYLPKNQKLVLGYINGPIDKSQKYIGTIAVNSKGHGFVTLDNEKKATFYVYHTNLNGALNGDKVSVYKMEKDHEGDLIDAVVDEIIEHNRNFCVCLFNKKSDKEYEFIPDDSKEYLPIVVDSVDIEGLVDGSKVLIQLNHFEKDKIYGTISRIIGHKDDPNSDILSIVYDNGVNPDFEQDVLDYANNLKLDINQKQKSLRHDLTNELHVTIDPATSKDFDDSILVKKNTDGTYKLFVSIADVAHYAKYGSLLNESAKKRGTSIYLTDRVIPMIPHSLSNDLCSLNPNVKRFAITCEMDIDENANYKSIQVYPSIIESKRRFSYDEVNDFFKDSSSLKQDTKEIKEMLSLSYQLYQILNAAKTKRGYINFNVPEPKIICDEKGFPIDIQLYQSGQAQEMIENFMLCANECVTKFVDKKGLPFIYRIHDKPNEDKIKNLLLETKKLNFKITTDLNNIQPNDIAKWFADNIDNPNMDIINIMMLRTMAKAEYSSHNIGHFGLALKQYTHFTSPIRRYPDLMVGNVLWMNFFDKDSYSKELIKQFNAELESNAKLSSKNEIISVNCEREVNSMMFAKYMTKHIGEEYEAFVNGVSGFGVFVELPNTIEGLIKINNLGTDFYIYNEQTKEIIGKTTNQRFSLGTKLIVKCISSNPLTREIDFIVVKYLGNR